MREPLICLNMIVKNEAHVIRRCLDSMQAVIDTWLIVDTGSTDGTQQVIRQYFHAIGKPGELVQRAWQDFGTNRMEALELARPKARYTLFIDADEIFEMPPDMPMPELTADGYQFLFRHNGSDHTYWRTQLVRNDKPWIWEGVLHEVLTCGVAHLLEKLVGPTFRSMFDSNRNQVAPSEKYAKDALILEDALEKDPNNARYVFYLGQSWRDANQLEKALEAYRRRSTMQAWEEEGWYAQFQVARMLENLGRRAEAIEAYLKSFERRAQRAEPLCDLARMHRELNAFHLAHLFSSRARDLKRPDDILFVDESVYRWRVLDEYSIACYWINDFAECLRVTELLLAEGRAPAEQRARIEKNREFAKARLE